MHMTKRPLVAVSLCVIMFSFGRPVVSRVSVVTVKSNQSRYHFLGNYGDDVAAVGHCFRQS